jgi:hypothetical protein
MEKRRVRVRVRLTGIKPRKCPASPVEGWIPLRVPRPFTVGSVLAQSGLDPQALRVLKGGAHAGLDDPVSTEDPIEVFLKSIGK